MMLTIIKSNGEQIDYKGISHQISRDDKFFALTMVEGDYEIWSLESPECVRELDRYFKDSGREGYFFKILTQTGFYSDPMLESRWDG